MGPRLGSGVLVRRVASAADAAASANRCAPLRCLPTAAITHLYGHPAPVPRAALRRHMTNQYAANRLNTYLFDTIY